MWGIHQTGSIRGPPQPRRTGVAPPTIAAMGHGGDDGGNPAGARRDVRALPKAHLHLHFTGSMRHGTLLELAERDGIALPDSLVEDWPPQLSAADEKGWFRFQRLYDVARSVLRTPDDVRRLVREAAEDDVADGGRWLEIQVDPSGYAARFGGITAFTDLVLDCVRDASERTGLPMAVVIAANRTRHPLDARTLARLAAQYAGRGVVGFGLSNDERRGTTADFAPAFAIAERAGLLLAPHGGELRGPDHIRLCLDELHADRLGHGVRAAEDPALLDRDRGGRGGARGLPGLQRRARRLLRPHLGAPPPADGRGRHHRARRRRPAALRLPAGRPVRHDARRPRAHRRRPGLPGPVLVRGLAGPRRRTPRRPGRDRRVARRVRTTCARPLRLGGCPREQPGPARPAAGTRSTVPRTTCTPTRTGRRRRSTPGRGPSRRRNPYGSADTSSYGTPADAHALRRPAGPAHPAVRRPAAATGRSRTRSRTGRTRTPSPAPTGSRASTAGTCSRASCAPAAPLGHHRAWCSASCRSSGCSCAWSRS